MKTLTTLRENTDKVGCSAYWGERGEWLIAAAQHRDSDCLTRSNYRCFRADLEALPAVKEWAGEEHPIQVESFNHWAVGWVEYLLINPACQPAIDRAIELRAELEDYPILDEHDFSELESEDANETWQNCFNPKERIKYIREHRSQFEFQGMADLIGCVRGKYFAGYASELLS